MYIVIFRARIRQLDEQYTQMAARMRQLALDEFGCLEFQAVSEGEQEVALSYWPDQDSIHRWRAHAEHLLAQSLGRERWYAAYTVQVARIERGYRFPRH